jgi:hypothetical protein
LTHQHGDHRPISQSIRHSLEDEPTSRQFRLRQKIDPPPFDMIQRIRLVRPGDSSGVGHRVQIGGGSYVGRWGVSEMFVNSDDEMESVGLLRDELQAVEQ